MASDRELPEGHPVGSADRPAGEKETAAQRMEKYQRREEMSIWVAAAIAGYLGFIGVGAMEGAPSILSDSLLTLLLFAALFLALTRIGFEWAATSLKRFIDANSAEADIPEEHRVWPRGPERHWNWSLVLLVICGFVLLVGIWWDAVAGDVVS